MSQVPPQSPHTHDPLPRIPFKGTLVNCSTVLLGSVIGLLIGQSLSPSIKTIVFQALGLGTLLIGMKLALRARSEIVVIGALVLGAAIGAALNIQGGFEALGNSLKSWTGSQSPLFVNGFIFASILFCVGPMTIIGSIQDGAFGDARLLYLKSMLDGFASMALAAAMGIGVLFSMLTILVVQGALSLFGRFLLKTFAQEAVEELSATGGLIILGIGLALLEIKAMPVANFLPALAIVLVLDRFRREWEKRKRSA